MRNSLPTLALLAGGLATRMRPLTSTIPKSLLLIDGEPFIAHQLRLLAAQGVTDVVICAGYLGGQIERFVGGAGFGCRVRYSHDGKIPLGTGGALKRALPLLGENFFVMYGDSYLPVNFARAWRAFLAAGLPALMTVFRNEGRWDASNVEMLDDRIIRYEKGGCTTGLHYIDYGLSIFRVSVFEQLQGGDAFDLSTVISSLAAAGQLAAHEVRARFYEIGSLSGLRETERMVAALRKARESELLTPAGAQP